MKRRTKTRSSDVDTNFQQLKQSIKKKPKMSQQKHKNATQIVIHSHLQGRNTINTQKDRFFTTEPTTYPI